MPRKAHRWRILLMAGLSVAAAAYGIYYCCVPPFNAVAYDRIVESYFHKNPNTRDDSCYVDVWALWKELGINPSSLRESRSSYPRKLLNQGPYTFYAEPGKPVRLDCDFTCLGDTKVIAVTSDYHCTQVFVFKRQESTETSEYLFSYFFTSGLNEMADRSGVKLLELEPEPGLKLLEIFCRNSYGTGTCGFGWSLYRLDKTSAKCLVKTDTEGWSINEGPGGYGHRCDITDLKESWPKIGLSFFVEYVPSQSTDNQRGDDLVDIYELNTQVELTWDYRHSIFRPSPDNALSRLDANGLLKNPVEFLETKMHDMNYLSRPDCAITRKLRPQSECLSGWGL